MACNLGFEPTQSKEYFFISYNSVETNRVASIALELHSEGIPLWYDRGLELNENWENAITLKIQKCLGIIIFATKRLMQRDSSYVRREYSLAKFYNKPIFIVQLVNIVFEDVHPAL